MSHVTPGHVRCQAPDMAVSDKANDKVPAEPIAAWPFGHVWCLAPDVSGGGVS